MMQFDQETLARHRQTQTERAERLQRERIARRVQTLRKERGLTQEEVAAALGFKDRQTLQAIEAGERKVQPQELLRLAGVLGVAAETFLDPFRLVGEGEFSFRARADISQEILRDFESWAGQWIATYRELGRRAGEPPRVLTPKLDLTERSSFGDVAEAAEALVLEWQMGEVPAARLEEAIERLGILVLYVDAPGEISGAASRLQGLQTILVNRREPVGRRSFDLAHELFHILTWDTMRPSKVEPLDTPRGKGKRVEQLAENFAAALLMPSFVVRRRAERRGDCPLEIWVGHMATELRVSLQAFAWRLVNLGLLPKSVIQALLEQMAPTRVFDKEQPPRLFSGTFVRRIHDAVERGWLSLRRASGLLGFAPADFAALCTSYGLPLSYDAGPG